jgi:hypothetical protein
MSRRISQDAVPGAGFPPSSHHGHPFTVPRVPGDGLVDDSGVRGHDAGGQGHVTFGYPAVFYLIGEFLVGVVVLGDHHQSRSIFVQPVDDARPDFAANPLNVGASGQ